jgi:hypothetical protein
MTWVPPPTAKPSSTRLRESVVGSGEMAPGDRAQRERHRDEHDRLLAAEPLREVAAQERPEDRSGEDARGDDGLPTLLDLKSSVICSSAPAIIPVS